MHLPITGSKLAGFVSTISQVFSTMSQYHGTYAGLRNTEGGWDRREREWSHQIELIGVELEQIERQILASERRRDVSLKELNNQVQQIENSREVLEFTRDKFTNHELFLWMQKETAALHAQMYELAYLLAKQAERAFNYERGFTSRIFIKGDLWDNLHEGLLSGERLQHALRIMEKAYYDENIREYELTKSFSLRQHFPSAFVLLKTTGCCEIEIPEWMFDMDYPGHYMRRIKSMTINIPVVVGPYTGVHARLSLLSSKTRIKPTLDIATPENCELEDLAIAYQTKPDDLRIVNNYATSEAIATSSGQNDTGLFEINFNDDRYLPFEYKGAVSCWRIELPHENNYFNMDSLSDVILQMNYMAREGGTLLRSAANAAISSKLPGDGVRFLDVKHEMPDSWHQYINCEDKGNLCLKLNRSMFPFLACNAPVKVTRLEIMVLLKDCPEQVKVEFIESDPTCPPTKKVSKDKQYDICLMKLDLKVDCYDVYHGITNEGDGIELGPINADKPQKYGAFVIDASQKQVKNIFLLCHYEKVVKE